VDSLPRRIVLLVCNFLFVALFFGYVAAGTITVFAIFRTLHGIPFGGITVAASTVAIDVLPSSRRTEGIGYYGVSHNISTAIGPAIAIVILNHTGGNFQYLFYLSILSSLLGLIIDATIKVPKKDYTPPQRVLSLDRFFLIKGFRESISIILFAACYGILSTYVAIYGKEELGITSGTGMFFTLFAIGLIISRLTGARSLKKNLITRNATFGVLVALSGYIIFAALHNPVGYYLAAFTIGMGNGHMYPAFQNMFINLAEHNQRGTANSSILTAWDGGIGIGMLLGGVIAEHIGYHEAFWAGTLLNAVGVAFYFLVIRRHFEANRLR